MLCPYLVEAKPRLCNAVDGLFHPSVVEERAFCRDEHHIHCGIFTSFSRTAEKVSPEYYLEEIQDIHFEDSVIY